MARVESFCRPCPEPQRRDAAFRPERAQADTRVAAQGTGPGARRFGSSPSGPRISGLDGSAGGMHRPSDAGRQTTSRASRGCFIEDSELDQRLLIQAELATRRTSGPTMRRWITRYAALTRPRRALGCHRVRLRACRASQAWMVLEDLWRRGVEIPLRDQSGEIGEDRRRERRCANGADHLLKNEPGLPSRLRRVAARRDILEAGQQVRARLSGSPSCCAPGEAFADELAGHPGKTQVDATPRRRGP